MKIVCTVYLYALNDRTKFMNKDQKASKIGWKLWEEELKVLGRLAQNL